MLVATGLVWAERVCQKKLVRIRPESPKAIMDSYTKSNNSMITTMSVDYGEWGTGGDHHHHHHHHHFSCCWQRNNIHPRSVIPDHNPNESDEQQTSASLPISSAHSRLLSELHDPAEDDRPLLEAYQPISISNTAEKGAIGDAGAAGGAARSLFVSPSCSFRYFEDSLSNDGNKDETHLLASPHLALLEEDLHTNSTKDHGEWGTHGGDHRHNDHHFCYCQNNDQLLRTTLNGAAAASPAEEKQQRKDEQETVVSVPNSIAHSPFSERHFQMVNDPVENDPPLETYQRGALDYYSGDSAGGGVPPFLVAAAWSFLSSADDSLSEERNNDETHLLRSPNLDWLLEGEDDPLSEGNKDETRGYVLADSAKHSSLENQAKLYHEVCGVLEEAVDENGALDHASAAEGGARPFLVSPLCRPFMSFDEPLSEERNKDETQLLPSPPLAFLEEDDHHSPLCFLPADDPLSEGNKDETSGYIADDSSVKHSSVENQDKRPHGVCAVEEQVVDETSDAALPQALFTGLKLELDLLVFAYQSNQHDKSPIVVNCAAFIKAERQDFHHVHSSFYYNAFLRSEGFHVKAAAIRMIGYYEMKEWCFGCVSHLKNDDKYLCQDITLDMMMPGDISSMCKGGYQVLPQRDRLGRCIYLNIPQLTHFESPESLGRMYMYDSWSMAQDEDTQRRGMVMVCFAASDNHEPPVLDMELPPIFARSIITAGLVKCVVIHQCYSHESFKHIIEQGLQFLPQNFRARTKFHHGSPMECISTLKAFGVSDQALPFAGLRGELKLKNHTDWIKMRARQDQMIQERTLKPMSQFHPGVEWNHDNGAKYAYHHSELSIVVVPTLSDILSGRGTKINFHKGNLDLQKLVDATIPEYEAAKRPQKKVISERLVQQVKKEAGGRFLKQDPQSGVWQVSDDGAARLKVAHLFRARRASVLTNLAKKKKKEGRILTAVTAKTPTSDGNHVPAKRAKVDC